MLRTGKARQAKMMVPEVVKVAQGGKLVPKGCNLGLEVAHYWEEECSKKGLSSPETYVASEKACTLE